MESIEISTLKKDKIRMKRRKSRGFGMSRRERLKAEEDRKGREEMAKSSGNKSLWAQRVGGARKLEKCKAKIEGWNRRNNANKRENRN